MPSWPPRTVGLVGDLFPIKNHMGLIEVVRALRERGIPAEGLLVGRPSANSGAHERYAESLAELTRDPNVCVRLVPAAPAEMPQRLAEIDTLLHLTTVPETFGRVCAEAMAAGRPVVAFNHGAVADVVGSAGVLCPPGDLDSVVDAVATLWADPAAYERDCARARERAITEYGSDQDAPTIGDYIAEFALKS